jgi:hypothetical protein
VRATLPAPQLHPAVDIADDGAVIQCQVWGIISTATSTPTTLTLTAPVGPYFVSQPTNQNVLTGDLASFSVVVGNSASPTFQWAQDGACVFFVGGQW